MENNEIKQVIPQTEEARQEALGVLRASFEMYERTRNDTIEARKRTNKNGALIYPKKQTQETLELIDTMQADIIQQYSELGGNLDDLNEIRQKKNVIDRSSIKKYMENDAGENKTQEVIRDIKEKRQRRAEKFKNAEKIVKKEPVDGDTVISRDNEGRYTANPIDFSSKKEEKVDIINEAQAEYAEKAVSDIPQPVKINERDNATYNENRSKVNYDTVTLPSNGECYKNKVKEIKVSHLVAYDENLILSPSLYANGTFLDHILKNKILDDINPDDLVQGDRDAIIIWLRANAYGNDYPVRVTDDKTGKEYDTTVDLSQLKFKKFNLKGDNNGYFDFVLPKSGDVIKFRFLTNGDIKKLEKLRKEENKEEKITEIKQFIREIRSFIEDSPELGDSAADGLDAVEDEIYEKFKDIPETYFTHDLTNRLIMSTVSVNGISDRAYVTNYIINMNLKDAADYRKYIVENEPGIDYNVKVKRPDSLGGGYIDTFLQLSQFIFVY